MQAAKKWYALYTKPRWEKKVAGLLSEKKIHVYCPLNRVVKQWSDRKKLVQEPLFQSYVFVQVGNEEMLEVKETDGVLNFVYWLGKPAVIRDEEIETIQRFLNEHLNVQLEKVNVNVHDTVRIVSGPFMQCEGSVLSVQKNKVKVLLPSLGYAMIAEMDKTNMEVVKKHQKPPSGNPAVAAPVKGMRIA